MGCWIIKELFLYKIKEKTVRILFLLIIFLAVANSATANCNLNNMEVILSRYRLCEGDKTPTYFFISGLEGCSGKKYSIVYREDVVHNADNLKYWSAGVPLSLVTSASNGEPIKEGGYGIKWENDGSKKIALLLPESQDWNGYLQLHLAVWTSIKAMDYTITIYNEDGTAKTFEGKLNDFGWNNVTHDLLHSLTNEFKKAIKKIEFSVKSNNFDIIIDDVTLLKAEEKIIKEGKLEESTEGFFLITSQAPITKLIQLEVRIEGEVKKIVTIEMNKKSESPQICYNSKAQMVECSQSCESELEQRLWKFVQATSIPMHFTFATESKYSSAPNASLSCFAFSFGHLVNVPYIYCCQKDSIKCDCATCEQSQANKIWKPAPSVEQDTVYGTANFHEPGSSVGNWKGVYFVQDGGRNYTAPPNDFVSQPDIINAPELKTQGCNGGKHCTYETHNYTRYAYKWSIEYDVVTTALSKSEYVPMYVGVEQLYQNPNFAETQNRLSGSCFGDNLCYTEFPMCGDGICDTKNGERCWNCEADCKTGPDYENNFLGDCTKEIPGGSCSRCPLVENTPVADARGCIINLKKEGEPCSCSIGECGISDQKSVIGGDGAQLYCKKEILVDEKKKELKEGGHCCHKDEIWDPNYEYNWGRDINNDGDMNDGACVVYRKIDIQNIHFSKVKEKGPKGFIQEVCCGEERAKTSWIDIKYDIINLGDYAEKFETIVKFSKEKKSISEIWGEMITTEKSAPYGYTQTELSENFIGEKTISDRIACVHTTAKNCEENSKYVNFFVVPDSKTTIVNMNGHTYPSYLYYPYISCDVTKNPMPCSNGQQISLEGFSSAPEAICGGWSVWNDMDTDIAIEFTGNETWVPAFVPAWEMGWKRGIFGQLYDSFCQEGKYEGILWCRPKYLLIGKIIGTGCWADCSLEGCEEWIEK